ncbi:hypothetical protein [Roseobacter sp. S98]|uniref:hypothetical protein n=1 Tax=Roseobacter algicola (ex Choi et al. 2025) (nom. illeg.) TaxID=3092138 RepID=UPI0035C6D9C4
MRRKAFCVVVDIEPRRFDTMLTRGQVPFSKKEEGWGQYSLNDAFLMRLMLDLIDNGGCEIESAVIALRVALTTHWLDAYPLTREIPDEDTWVAIGSIAYGSRDEYTMSQEFLAGSVWGIPRMMQGIGENTAETLGLLDRTEIFDGENGPDIRKVEIENPDYALGRIIMANASLAARKVIKAADALEIELTEDDFPEFPDDAYDALSSVAEACDGWNKHLERIERAKGEK